MHEVLGDKALVDAQIGNGRPCCKRFSRSLVVCCAGGGCCTGGHFAPTKCLRGTLKNGYWTRLSNWYELFLIFIFTYFVMQFRRVTVMKTLLRPIIKESVQDDYVYVPLDGVVQLELSAQDSLAMLFMLTGIHLLKAAARFPYLGVGPRVGAITRTISHPGVLPFYAVLAFLLLAYSFGLLFAFGNEVIEYSDPIQTLTNAIRITFGDFDVSLESLQESNFLVSLTMFVFFLMLVTLLLMNVFIAVVSNVYNEALNSSFEKHHMHIDEAMAKQLSKIRFTEKIF